MLMTDGVAPGNEGRGYILRRLLRRSIRAMRLLGVDAPSFEVLFAASRDAMSAAYPEITEHYDRVSRLALGEEEAFLRTLANLPAHPDSVPINRLVEVQGNAAGREGHLEGTGSVRVRAHDRRSRAC